MERKELFSAVRDESGRLVLYFPKSNIDTSPGREFWRVVIREIEICLETSDEPTEEGDKYFREVRDIIQECLEDW